MQEIQKIKEQLKVILDKVEDKETVGAITLIDSTLDTVNDNYTKLSEDNKNILSDYKELVKHTSFKLDSAPTTSADNAVDFDSIFKDYCSKLNAKSK